MGLLAEYFGNTQYLNLADSGVDKGMRRPKSVSSNSTTTRTVKDTINVLMERDWFTFATVNTTATMFSRPSYEIVSEDTDTWTKFFKDMRLYGNNTSLRRLRSDIKRDMIGYGAGYAEYVFDINGKEIVDLKRIDASRMDNAKDRSGQLILDLKGNSIGYVLSLGPNADLRSKGDTIPEPYTDAVNLNNGDIFLLRQRVAEFPLYKRSNGIEAIGLIEPAIQQTNRRRDLETAQVNAIWIRGTAPLFALVGDPNHEPNPQMLEDAADSLEEMKHSTIAAFPYYQEPRTLDAKIDDISTTVMNGLMSASAGAASIPKPFITGEGEATNRSTLKTQRELFEQNIQDKIDNFDEDWNLQIMDVIGDINGYAKATIESGDIRIEAKDEFAKRLKMYFDMRAFSPKEIRDTIVKVENIVVDEEDYDEYINTPEPQSVSQSISTKGNPMAESDDSEENDADNDVTSEE